MSKQLIIFTLLLIILGLATFASVSMYQKTHQTVSLHEPYQYNEKSSGTQPQSSKSTGKVQFAFSSSTDANRNDPVRGEAVISLNTSSHSDRPGTLLYETSEREWIIPFWGGDGCDFLTYKDKKTGSTTGTGYRACPNVSFEETSPLFIKNCDGDYGLSACLNFSPLQALNLDTGEEITILDTHTLLQPGETYVQSCMDGNYGQACSSDIHVEGTVMKIAIFKKEYTPQFYQRKYDPTQPLEFSHTKVREVTVDLAQFK